MDECITKLINEIEKKTLKIEPKFVIENKTEGKI
jgi:hypothetical protein